MQDFGLTVTIPDLSQLSGAAAMSALHDHASEIAEEIETRIEGRTPRDTGALYEDETFTLGSGNELVSWYVGTGYQEAENHRVYSVYQEGPPLGLSTYTNAPHQMYFKVTTDDLPTIADWAQQVVQEATDRMAADATAGAITEEL